MRFGVFLVQGAALLSGSGLVAQKATPKTEFGRVHWQREFDAALKANTAEKPVFALFQEVPGWATCVNFGQQVLSHALLVEAIENEFLPVATRNNVGGVEASILKRYKEPTWNNPVVRFLKPDGTDVIPRKDRVWSVQGTASRMVQALEASKRKVPEYLRLVAIEKRLGKASSATFGMYWFWEGEAAFGSLPGVLSTRSAWIGSKEVVVVKFDETETSLKELKQRAKKLRNSLGQLEGKVRAAKASDQLYYLSQSKLRWLPLTELQRVRVNAALGKRMDPNKFLSPAQRKLAKRLAGLPKAAAKKLTGLRPPALPNRWAAYLRELRRRLK